MKKKVYLTAGHNIVNGKGTGVHHKGRDEAKEAVVLRDMIADNLRSRCIEVVTDDNATSFGKVMTWLKNKLTAADTAIEIHFDAFHSSRANGCTAIVPTKPTENELNLARKMAAAIKEAAHISPRGTGGVRDESYTYHKRLRHLHSPEVATNVLLEVCFITSDDDWNKYQANKDDVALLLANSIFNYLHGK